MYRLAYISIVDVKAGFQSRFFVEKWGTAGNVTRASYKHRLCLALKVLVVDVSVLEMYFVINCFWSWNFAFESSIDNILLIEMFEQVISGAVAMLIVIILISIAFAMLYVWFLRVEDRTPTRSSSSLRKKRETFNRKERYTVFHSLYEAIRDKEGDKKDE